MAFSGATVFAFLQQAELIDNLNVSAPRPQLPKRPRTPPLLDSLPLHRVKASEIVSQFFREADFEPVLTSGRRQYSAHPKPEDLTITTFSSSMHAQLPPPIILEEKNEDVAPTKFKPAQITGAQPPLLNAYETLAALSQAPRLPSTGTWTTRSTAVHSSQSSATTPVPDVGKLVAAMGQSAAARAALSAAAPELRAVLDRLKQKGKGAQVENGAVPLLANSGKGKKTGSKGVKVEVSDLPVTLVVPGVACTTVGAGSTTEFNDTFVSRIPRLRAPVRAAPPKPPAAAHLEVGRAHVKSCAISIQLDEMRSTAAEESVAEPLGANDAVARVHVQQPNDALACDTSAQDGQGAAGPVAQPIDGWIHANVEDIPALEAALSRAEKEKRRALHALDHAEALLRGEMHSEHGEDDEVKGEHGAHATARETTRARLWHRLLSTDGDDSAEEVDASEDGSNEALRHAHSEVGRVSESISPHVSQQIPVKAESPAPEPRNRVPDEQAMSLLSKDEIPAESSVDSRIRLRAVERRYLEWRAEQAGRTRHELVAIQAIRDTVVEAPTVPSSNHVVRHDEQSVAADPVVLPMDGLISSISLVEAGPGSPLPLQQVHTRARLLPAVGPSADGEYRGLPYPEPMSPAQQRVGGRASRPCDAAIPGGSMPTLGGGEYGVEGSAPAIMPTTDDTRLHMSAMTSALHAADEVQLRADSVVSVSHRLPARAAAVIPQPVLMHSPMRPAEVGPSSPGKAAQAKSGEDIEAVGVKAEENRAQSDGSEAGEYESELPTDMHVLPPVRGPVSLPQPVVFCPQPAPPMQAVGSGQADRPARHERQSRPALGVVRGPWAGPVTNVGQAPSHDLEAGLPLSPSALDTSKVSRTDAPQVRDGLAGYTMPLTSGKAIRHTPLPSTHSGSLLLDTVCGPDATARARLRAPVGRHGTVHSTTPGAGMRDSLASILQPLGLGARTLL